jgi:hypothetical protein
MSRARTNETFATVDDADQEETMQEPDYPGPAGKPPIGLRPGPVIGLS